MKNNLMTQEEAEEYSASIAKLAVGVEGVYELIEHSVYTLKVHKSLFNEKTGEIGMKEREWVEQTIGYPRQNEDERRESVKELVALGKEYEQIAIILGVSIATVGRDVAVLKAIQAQQSQDSPQGALTAGNGAEGISRDIRKKQTVEEQRPEIRRLIDAGKTDAEIALALGRGVATIGKERVAYKKELEAIAKTAPRPRSNAKRKLTEAEAQAILSGQLATIEGAALNFAGWWMAEGKQALAKSDLAWLDENIGHTEEKVTMILRSIRGIEADADDALAAWAAEAEGSTG